MNTVTITHTPSGDTTVFRSAANNFIDNVSLALEKLEREHGHVCNCADLGSTFTVLVR